MRSNQKNNSDLFHNDAKRKSQNIFLNGPVFQNQQTSDIQEKQHFLQDQNPQQNQNLLCNNYPKFSNSESENQDPNIQQQQQTINENNTGKKSEGLFMKQNQNQNVQQMQEEKRVWNKDDFEIKEYISKGRSGIVYKAIEKKSKVLVAIKIIKKQKIIENMEYINLKREIEIQSRLKHKHIVQIYGYYHDESQVYIVMEYAPHGSLFQHIQRTQNGLNEQQVARLSLQLATALEYMKKRHVLHRDLKLENIVIFDNMVLKIADFGNAMHILTGERRSFCGTREYLSPELINQESYSFPVDMWCLGILVYEMFFKVSPFQDENKDSISNNIKRLKYKFPDNKRVISAEAKDFISSMLQSDPNKRLTHNQIITHPFIIQNLQYTTPFKQNATPVINKNLNNSNKQNNNFEILQQNFLKNKQNIIENPNIVNNNNNSNIKKGEIDDYETYML